MYFCTKSTLKNSGGGGMGHMPHYSECLKVKGHHCCQKRQSSVTCALVKFAIASIQVQSFEIWLHLVLCTDESTARVCA